MENLSKIMQNVQKVEIIVDHSCLSETLDILDKIQVSGYTVFEHFTGIGDRGESCEEFYCNFQSSYILTVCTNDKQLNALEENITPLLKKAGGISLITDAQWIKH